MKILLVGDAQGVHENLYHGLVALGHECDIIVWHHNRDITIRGMSELSYLKNYGVLGQLLRPVINYSHAIRLSAYDIASYAHRLSFIQNPWILRYCDLAVVRKKVRIMSYTGLGCDEIALVYENNALPYRPCATCEAEDQAGKDCVKHTRKYHRKAVNMLNKNFDCVVSPMVEYEHATKLFSGNTARIPFPIQCESIPWRPANVLRHPIRIIHTPTRQGFKGTKIVNAAIQMLKKKNILFEYKMVSGLPWDEYQKVIADSDIVIDQLWSQSPGMNALWLLAMGKIVLSGNTDLNTSYYADGRVCPIVDAPPDAEKLMWVLESLLEGRDKLVSLPEKGRSYIKRYHNHVDVARAYVAIWRESMG